eukprot:TRINITY_DN1549_c0_g1_i3.p1 TRINITY_DN1549_c0_g1~~TRINITY_DN1549_c0_g1_i3.p1  ORF type:complete len:422 (-),score=36.65 TRINITY_DN1549_c0_g1_i3:219-1484(-)
MEVEEDHSPLNSGGAWFEHFKYGSEEAIRFKVEPTGMTGWLYRTLRPLLEPTNNIWVLLMQAFLVTPLTNITFLDVDYQLYLDLIFHRQMISRLGHYICMPMVCFSFFAWTAQQSLVPSTSGIRDYSIDSLDTWITVALIFYLLAALWYFTWGVYTKHFMICFMILPLAAVYVLATLFYTTFGQPIDALREWYNPLLSRWVAINPFMWMWIFSFLQAFSHLAEPYLPPRVSGSPYDWVSIADFRSSKIERGTYIISSIYQIIAGTIDEWCASFRLLPLFWLKLWYEFYGNCFKRILYYDEQLFFNKFVLATIQPELDFIGCRFQYRLRPEGLFIIKVTLPVRFEGRPEQPMIIYVTQEVAFAMDELKKNLGDYSYRSSDCVCCNSCDCWNWVRVAFEKVEIDLFPHHNRRVVNCDSGEASV